MAGRFLSRKAISELKRSEVHANGQQKREGTRFATAAIAWSCGCCQGYYILKHRPVADVTVQEEELSRKNK
jgi:hypothetical protein